MGKGNKPFVKNRLLDAYEKHPKLFDADKIKVYLERNSNGASKQKTEKGLFRKLSPVISGISFILSIFFLSNNITGFVVGNLTQNTSNYIGAVLFVGALVLAYFSFRGSNQ